MKCKYCKQRMNWVEILVGLGRCELCRCTEYLLRLKRERMKLTRRQEISNQYWKSKGVKV